MNITEADSLPRTSFGPVVPVIMNLSVFSASNPKIRIILMILLQKSSRMIGLKSDLDIYLLTPQ